MMKQLVMADYKVPGLIGNNSSIVIISTDAWTPIAYPVYTTPPPFWVHGNLM